MAREVAFGMEIVTAGSGPAGVVMFAGEDGSMFFVPNARYMSLGSPKEITVSVTRPDAANYEDDEDVHV